jgi:hypothetical protein
MEMGDGDKVDRFCIYPSGCEVGVKRSRGRRDLAAGAGVDQDEPLPGVDNKRGERGSQLVGWHERCRKRIFHFGEWRVADEFVGDRAIPDAVIERGHFERSEPVTIDAWHLGTRRWSGRGGRICASRERGQRRAGQKRPARQRRHVLSPVRPIPAASAVAQCVVWQHVVWQHNDIMVGQYNF